MTAHAENSVLKIDGLAFGVGNRILQRDVSLCLEQASRTAIIGPNGVGKSTLLRTILGLLPYMEGSIRILGKEVRQLNEMQRAKLVAYVPQQSQLQFPVPVADVVAWSRFAHAGSGRLAAADLDVVEATLAQFELQELRDQPFNQLSGGEQRRVLLARAVASDAPLFILDEPTAHLDMHHILRLQQTLLALQAAGKSLLLVLHDVRDVDACADQVLVMGKQGVYPQQSMDALIESGIVQDVYGVSIKRREQYYFAADEENTSA